VVQLILCLHPGNLKKNLIDANKGGLSWPELKSEADMIISTLKQSGQSLYDNVPGVKQFSDASNRTFQSPLVQKSGAVVSPAMEKQSIHKAANTTSTVTLTGVPIKEPYKVIEPLKIFEGKQRYPCINCKSDTPARHYYLQCQQLCMFSKCMTMNSPPNPLGQ
jgi:hypothetical protein